MTLLVVLWKGGVGGKQGLRGGEGSPAKSMLLPKDGRFWSSVHALLLPVSWASVCWSLL